MGKHDLTVLTGSIVAIVTPMKENGDVDLDCLRKLIDWHVDSKTDSIVVMGTTGESPTVTDQEWSDAVRVCVEQARGRIPVIAGTGTNCTRSTIDKTKTAKVLGADAALVVTPYYNKPTQEGLFQHYKSVVDAVPDMPICLYNVPGRTGCDLIPDTVERLIMAFPNSVFATKEASGKLERFTELRQRCPAKFKIYCGEDCITTEAIKLGADGVISVTTNVAPVLMAKMCRYAIEKKFDEADRIDHALQSLHKDLFCEPSPCPAKFCLAHMKMIPCGIRLPLLPLTEKNQERLLEAMRLVESVNATQ
eukprot:TRINITY_DN119047_c0_g1_i1.p1 TRINITY_DN119047_c0_g1~~TRINITY_DN119047_c0_g1_i1.p1  ORF type:complete len:306 (+),score=22.16 TRINITY_DN119047_c0_g1_i1:75-992(+)